MIRLVDHLAFDGEESSSGIRLKKALYAHLLERFKTDEDEVLQMMGLGLSNQLTYQADSSRLEWLIDAADSTDPTTKKKVYKALLSMYGPAKVMSYISALESVGTPKFHSLVKTLASGKQELWLESVPSIAHVHKKVFKVEPEADETINMGPEVDDRINTWLSYCNWLFEKAPHKSNAFIPFMKQVSNKTFRFKLLAAARDFPHLNDKAIEIWMEEAERVFEMQNQSLSWVFGSIGLAEDKKVLSNPVFSKWLEYLEHYNRENPSINSIYTRLWWQILDSMV
ncbi:hypothetical protein PsorP6_017322 [Peronosclerospora sorghi]|uniref:Uncharacterized protein n=1 Tax=Peronosclerospora sorghi TaxID=230839 RepID=A0ACC0WP34_9STRA|nr:hypothetical protein PsorP6_017322 [Peronosclerospora sorghi]